MDYDSWMGAFELQTSISKHLRRSGELAFYLALFHQLYLSLSSADQTAEDDLPPNIADSQKR